MENLIFGMSFSDIQRMQQKTYVRPLVDVSKVGDYGADPLGDGTFRMVPSGDIVDYNERCKRLRK